MQARITSQNTHLKSGIQPATLTIEAGRITRIDPPGSEHPGTIDLGETHLLPALVDTHVHLNEPGRTEWEGVWTGTQAAAAGGAGALVDMPLNSDPVTTTLAALEAKKQAIEGKLWVDVGLWGGVVPGNAPELAPMIRAGALGFKCFTCFSGIDEFPASTEQDLEITMPILRDHHVPLLVHAELESELRIEGNPADYRTYLHSRPKEWEDRAVAMIIELVKKTGCPAHIVHLSSSGALDMLRAAKKAGLPITAETCPHYLGLTAEEVPVGATQYKCAPPIRERENQELLWRALIDGTLDFVVTDHSPCIPALKRLDTGSFLDAWGGISSLQLGLRSVWTQAQARGIGLGQLIGWMSQKPARFAGIPGGEIVVGAPATLLAFDPDHREVLEAASLLHRHPLTPWAGKNLAGKVVSTWLRGEQVWDGAKMVGAPRGQVIRGQISGAKHE